MTVRSGARFGSLIALRSVGRDEGRVLCVCTRCQHAVIADTGALKDGSITSCGCCEPPTPAARPTYNAAREEQARTRRYRMWSGRR